MRKLKLISITGIMLVCLNCTLTKASAINTAVKDSTKKMDWLRPSADGSHFVYAKSGEKFIAWGANYDHDMLGRLIEDYWDDEWQSIVDDFHEMRSIGINVVRIHIQVPKFMNTPTEPNKHSLKQLTRLLKLAEENRIYVDITGLGCYHKKDVPEWYTNINEKDRWAVQARFWAAVAKASAKSPAVFCFDLMNEPLLLGPNSKKGTEWLTGFLGGMYFDQYLTLDQGKRSNKEVAKAWVDNLVTAIRPYDKRHMITVGVIPMVFYFKAPKLFYSPEVCENLDFVSVHIYPKKGEVPFAINSLKAYDIGKPVIVEEIFPLECTVDDINAFYDGSKDFNDGFIGFYWGKKDNPKSTWISKATLQAWYDYLKTKGQEIQLSLKQKQD